MEGSKSVATQDVLGDAVEAGNGLEESDDGSIVQIRELGKDQILIAEIRKLSGEHGYRFGAKATIRWAPGIEFAEHQVGLQRPGLGLYSRNRGQSLEQLNGLIPMLGAAAPIAN